MLLNHRKLMLPGLIIIAVCLLTGFNTPEKENTVTQLLEDRAFILQKAYYGEITIDEAEKKLCEVETQPLLREDLSRLREADFSEIDIIERLEIRNLKQRLNMFDKSAFEGSITWYMRGFSGNYITEADYFILVKSGAGQWKLSQFDLLEK